MFSEPTLDSATRAHRPLTHRSVLLGRDVGNELLAQRQRDTSVSNVTSLPAQPYNERRASTGDVERAVDYAFEELAALWNDKLNTRPSSVSG